MDHGDRWLFDPLTTQRLVLAHRGSRDPVVRCAVSDVVWSEVFALLRWARAATATAGALGTGILWRLAAGCGDLLRRLPGLSDEIAEAWRPVGGTDVPADLPSAERIDLAAGRLPRLLRSPGPVPLRV